MKIDLSGRLATVTGATAGIGRATAEGLALAGASVIINGRSSARVEEAIRQMRAAFPNVLISGVPAEGANALIEAAPDADILVNNVGTAFIRDYNGIADIAAIPDADWIGLFQLNVMSGVRLSRHYLPRTVEKAWAASFSSAANPGSTRPRKCWITA